MKFTASAISALIVFVSLLSLVRGTAKAGTGTGTSKNAPKVRFLFDSVDNSNERFKADMNESIIRLRPGIVEIEFKHNGKAFLTFYSERHQFHSDLNCNSSSVCRATIPYEKMEKITNYREESLSLNVSATFVAEDGSSGESFAITKGKVYYFESVKEDLSFLKEPTRIDSFWVKKGSYRPDYRIASVDARSKLLSSILWTLMILLGPLALLLRLLPSLSALLVSIPLKKESGHAFVVQLLMTAYLSFLVWNTIYGSTTLGLFVSILCFSYILLKKKK